MDAGSRGRDKHMGRHGNDDAGLRRYGYLNMHPVRVLLQLSPPTTFTTVMTDGSPPGATHRAPPKRAWPGRCRPDKFAPNRHHVPVPQMGLLRTSQTADTSNRRSWAGLSFHQY
ncbi:hypothetical protein GCM10010315_37530 [Streptomyces luteosporeus]|uniref:Uncharacterized protein n=1 Tax=Streptomyces luteosporeus TaxID=173856 RepID=A0ABN3TV94_9ACTN